MKILKKAAKIFGIVVCVVVAFLLVTTVYHQIALRIEAKRITPNGQMIDVGGYKIHVYSEGEESAKPTLVFLSGSATVAPVYDFKLLYRRNSFSIIAGTIMRAKI